MDEELAGTISRLIEANEEATEIRTAIRAQHAAEFDRVEELDREAETLRTRAGDLLRAGRTSQSILGYQVLVTVPHKKVVDIHGVLARAKDRGDLPALLEAGALYYDAKPEQFERLGGQLQAAYTQFVRFEEQTPRVTFPAALK